MGKGGAGRGVLVLVFSVEIEEIGGGVMRLVVICIQ